LNRGAACPALPLHPAATGAGGRGGRRLPPLTTHGFLYAASTLIFPALVSFSRQPGNTPGFIPLHAGASSFCGPRAQGLGRAPGAGGPASSLGATAPTPRSPRCAAFVAYRLAAFWRLHCVAARRPRLAQAASSASSHPQPLRRPLVAQLEVPRGSRVNLARRRFAPSGFPNQVPSTTSRQTAATDIRATRARARASRAPRAGTERRARRQRLTVRSATPRRATGAPRSPLFRPSRLA
jgi:hypothetical protein